MYHGVEYHVIHYTHSSWGPGRIYISIIDDLVFSFGFSIVYDTTEELELQADAIMKTVEYHLEPAEETPVQPPADSGSNGLITKAGFDQIEMGMTYDQVVKIAGSSGELLSRTDLGMGSAYVTEIYIWYGKGMTGANCNVTFQGGKAVGKAQFGLE